MSFEAYLKKRQLGATSIKLYQRSAGLYHQFLESHHIIATEASYSDVLEFTQSLQQTMTDQQVRDVLCGIRHYYQYLKTKDQTIINPANGLYLKKRKQRIAHDLLSEEQLEELYQSFELKDSFYKSKDRFHKPEEEDSFYKPKDRFYKLLLGLLIYQGLTTGEIQQLRKQDVEFKQGRIRIPSSKRSSSRYLKLEAVQVYELQEYLQTQSHTKPTDYLLHRSSSTFYHHFKKLTKALKIYPYYKNTQQLRQSRIAIWTRQYDLRYAQYLSGHKRVGSTERYDQRALQELSEELKKRHPLG
jgi:integrase/recombinase XerD